MLARLGAVMDPELPAPVALVVQELLDERLEAWCDLVLVDERTWAIRGSIAYEGEVILAEFETRDLAELALERLVTTEGSTYARAHDPETNARINEA
jgi:hypothetical protein